jgi:hypothetical protein
MVVAIVLVSGCGAKTDGKPEEPKGSAQAETLAQLEERTTKCAQSSDCEHLGDRCAWGCAVTVNKKYTAEVEAWLGAKHEQCNMDCPPVGPPACVQGRCRSPQRQDGATAGGECRTADDCAIVCFASADDCCGAGCGCDHAMPKADVAALTKQRAAKCAGKPLDGCPQWKCVEKTTYVPACDAGKCTAVVKTP